MFFAAIPSPKFRFVQRFAALKFVRAVLKMSVPRFVRTPG